jgi:hypothetical protein
MKFTQCIPVLAFVSLAFAAFAAEGPATFKVSDLTFTRPADWAWVETTSPMRQAQLKVADPASKGTAEVIFFYFGPGGAGGTKANVDRWLGQFAEPREKINPRIEESAAGKHKVTYVRAEGTYRSGVPGGPLTPLPDHALLGAIIEAPQGHVFVRLTAPKEFAEKLAPEFKKMTESALK